MFYKKKDEGSFERDKNLDFIDSWNGNIFRCQRIVTRSEKFLFNLIMNSET